MKRKAMNIMPFLFAWCTVHAQVNLLRGPYLQTVTSNSIIIRWRTDVATQSLVQYGTTRSFGLSQTDTSHTTEHIITLNGLGPHKKYFYSIGNLTTVLQSDTADYFYTLPTTGTERLYRIALFGDCGNNSVNQVNVKQSLLNYLGGNYLDSWILLGDNAYNSGTETDYQSGFFNIYKNDLLKKFPLWTSPGNHDYDNSIEKQKSHDIPYYNLFSFPTIGQAGGIPSGSKSYFSFNIGNIHFLSLDSYGLEADTLKLYDTLSPQVQWVKKDLDSNTNKGWVVVVFHHPPYTLGSHNSDTEFDLQQIRQNFIRILERYKVDLVICGHSHVYERSALMKGYYGNNASFDAAAYDLSTSKGTYDGSANSCPYVKDSSNRGTLYMVTGSAGQLGGTQTGFPMKSMQYSDAANGGAMVLEVQANRLDAKWVCADGQIRDRFTMMKQVGGTHTVRVNEGDSAALAASYIGRYIWNDPTYSGRTIKVAPDVGSYTFTVHDLYNCINDTFNVVVAPIVDSQIVYLRAGILDQYTNGVFWRTDKEVNTDYFELQHSVDKLKFVALSRTPSQGDANNGESYNGNDVLLDPAIKKYYYRIKTVFKNGTAAYSRTVAVTDADPDSSTINASDIVIAPNPALPNQMRIKLARNLSVVADLSIHDANGRLVSSKTMVLTNAFQRFMPPVSSGYYIVSVTALGVLSNKKIIVY